MRNDPTYGGCYSPRFPLPLTLKNHDGGCVVFGVGEAEVGGRDTATLGEFQALAVENELRSAGIESPHLHVVPAEINADAGLKGFGGGFLGGEPGGEMWERIGMVETVFDLGFDEDSLREAFPELLVRLGDADDLDDVNARSEDHSFPSARASRGRRG